MKRGARVRTTSLIGYCSSTRVHRVPGTKLSSGPSAIRWMRPASSRPITRLVAPRYSGPRESFMTSMTSLTVRACARAAVVASTTLVVRRRSSSRPTRGGGLGEFLGGVADDADDAQRAAGLVAAHEALGVGPAQAAVPAADAEVHAVVDAAVLQRLRDERVQPEGLGGRHPGGQRVGPVVVLVGAQVEDAERGLVHVQETGGQVPVETAHPQVWAVGVKEAALLAVGRTAAVAQFGRAGAPCQPRPWGHARRSQDRAHAQRGAPPAGRGAERSARRGRLAQGGDAAADGRSGGLRDAGPCRPRRCRRRRRV